MIPQCENLSVRSISREVEYAWLAGIIDGEANIQATMKIAGNGKGYFMPKIRIGNTDVRMIKRISQIYSGLNVCWFYTIRKRKKINPTWKTMLNIEMASQGSVKKVLQAVLPYMVNKKEAAKLLVELIEWIQAQPKGGNTVSNDYTQHSFYKSSIEKFLSAYNFRFDPSETTRRARKVLAW